MSEANTKKTSKGRGVVYLWAVLAIAAWVVTGYGAMELIRYQKFDAAWVGSANGMRVMASQLSANAAGSAQGRTYSFEQLGMNRSTFQRHLATLKQGDAASGIPPAPPELMGLINTMEATWQEIATNIDAIASAQKDLTGRDAAFEAIAKSSGPRLVTTSQALTEYMGSRGYQQAAIDIAKDHEKAAERLVSMFAQLAKPQADVTSIGDDATKLLTTYRSTIARLQSVNDPELQKRVAENRAVFTQFNDQALSLLANDNAKVMAASAAIDEKVPPLDTSLRQIAEAVGSLEGTRFVQLKTLGGGAIIGLVFFAMMFVAVIGISSAKTDDARSLAEQLNRQKAKVEDEIRQTVAEIEPVADGDLTARAVENRPNTGMFAKAVNRITKALESIVEQVRTSVNDIGVAIEETKQVTENIAGSTHELTKEAQRSAQLATKLDKTADHTSKRAREMADLANATVGAVMKGQQAVRQTAKRVDEVRANNKDTIHDIKNLVENMNQSSLIIEQIGAVSDKLTALAINAGLLAQTIPGDEGRMMANIATEIQGLADNGKKTAIDAASIITKLMSTAEETSGRMEQATKNIHRTLEDSNAAMSAFDEISDMASKVQAEAAKIDGQMEETKRDAAQMAEASKMGESVAIQVSNAAEETKRAIAGLGTGIRKLTELTRVFKVGGAA